MLFDLLTSGSFVARKTQKGKARRRLSSPVQVELLEQRTLLSGMAPSAMYDSYDVPYDDFDTAALSQSSVLDNDMDMESDPLTAVLVNDVSHGTLSLGSNGHFTYTPDDNYVGSDSFTYKAFDGTGYSSEATVTLNVTKAFSTQTNLADRPSAPASGMETFGVSLLTGGVEVVAPVAPDQALVYQSSTDPLPIIAVETDYTGDMLGPTPSQVEVQLSVGGITGDALYYSGTLSSGISVRFAHQIDADTLATGRYDYEMTVIAHYSGGLTSTSVFTGVTDIVNRNESEFGDNWSLAELDRLHIDTGGILHVTGTGVASWFEDNGDGTFDSPAGPLASATLVQNLDNSYTLTDKYGNVWEFDSTGLLTSRADRNGNSTTYDYIDADSDSVVDELETITDPFARETTFTYTSGLLTSVTDFAGRVTGLDYDTYDRLIEVTAPDPDDTGSLTSPVTSYGYDSTSSRLTAVTDPLNRTTVIEYDFAGRFDEATYTDQSTISFDAYQTRGLVDTSSGDGSQSNPADYFLPDDPFLTSSGSLIDMMSQPTDFATDRFGYLTAYKNALGQRTDYERNADGQVTKLTEPGARVTEYTYDANGNLTEITYPDSTVVTWVYNTTINQPTSFTDELLRETTFTYDSVGNLLTVTDPLGNATGYEYDTAGRLIEITLTDPDDTGLLASPVIGYAYDTYGRLVEITNPDATTVVYAWDTADRITSITDELSRETAFTYDNLDRLLTVTQPDPDDTGPLAAPVWTYTYNAVGNLLTQVDPAGNTTGYAYDNRNRLVQLTEPDPDGAGSLAAPVWAWTYNAAGNVTTATDPLGNVTAYSYDTAGRLSSVTLPDPDGAGGLSSAVISYTRDSLGRVTSVNDELGWATSFEYDTRDRLTKQTDPDPDGTAGPLASPVTEWAYDDAGQLTSVTDPLGRVTSYDYNDAGRLTKTTLPDPDGAGSLTAPEYTLAYDDLGRVISSTDPLGNVTSFEYDVNSRLTKQTAPDPDGAGPLAAPVTQWAYDNAGQLTSVTDPLGRVTAYDYDDLGRLIETTLPDPDGAGSQTSPVFSLTYDILGNVLTSTDALGNVTSYAYDNLSRLTQVTQADPDDTGPLAAPVIGYAYNAAGRVTSVTDPLGRTTSYVYDNLGRLITTTLPDPDGAGSLTAPEYETTYDQAGNVLTRTDPLGNVTT